MSRPPASKKGWLAHYSELVGTWARRADSPQDAEDATHDAILRVLENDAAALANPRAYLHRSVRNRLIDKHRQSRLLDVVPLHELEEYEHPLLTDPDAQARTAQLLASLKEALAELPFKCRQVFLLHRLEGHTQEEIAQKLGISVNMVEKHMTRTVRHLRERLHNHAPN
ncbi:sigma-70 family RNA polymerase sigma factor [Pusillimonas noertemannii]|uniref:RNA polymerase sigma-70 factor (ECF subfamily) n=1 Tax=Pusillimonas noertemannii TaxID=305977 RepID=A0A2U1CJ08_9BURK|nr:sigma-70 family RNA polymerase sigma factor [Pusillimonas noertemannii]NYT70042.1 sigma-70 family RNA polymerase sigma factor [Pusillimonas noertemannii]PVY60989.1 RNA polymerase sigma-70 factor (ECF subfamily) [Pusillimonas noertemannii]TFL08355.1 sigma-70 family RNA polymerase sigma factor [Pusillimonas noertemannii]